MRKKILCTGGMTILELVISVIVFGLFLLAVYATMNVGLKSWQLGESKSDLNQKAEVTLQRILRDIKYTNMISMQIENYGEPNMINDFICFESPVNFTQGTFKVDYKNVGLPVWQGHILYYTKEPDFSSAKKDLFRKFQPRPNPSIYPLTLTKTLTGLNIYINDTSGSNISTVAKDIYSIDFDRYGTKITVAVCFKKHIRTEASVSFEPGSSAETGIEVVELKASVNPSN